MGLRKYPGRGHRYLYNKSFELFPFGYGLSYNEWKFGPPTFSSTNKISVADLERGHVINFTVSLSNMGKQPHEAKKSALALIKHKPPRPQDWPLQWLLDFQKVSVASGSIAQLTFSIGYTAVSRWDKSVKNFTIMPGSYNVWVLDAEGILEFEII